MKRRPNFDENETTRHQYGGTMFDVVKSDVVRGIPHDDDAVMRAKVYLAPKLEALWRERDNAFRDGARELVSFCTADDADRFLVEWKSAPMDLALRGGNWKGSIFLRSRWFRLNGMVVKSTRDRMNSTDLACWSLREGCR